MRWVGRLAARRVVWIVVGLAVYAILAAVGVRAAGSTPVAAVSLTPGGAAVDLASAYCVAGESVSAVVPFTSDGTTGTFNLGLNGAGGDAVGPTAYFSASPWSSSVGPLVCPGAGLVVLTVHWLAAGDATFWATDGTGVLDVVAAVGPSPSPSSPSSGLGCDPFCTVALVAEDRDRIDLLTYTVVTAAGLGVFTLAVVAMATSLKGR